MPMVPWDVCIIPKDVGGLGLIDVETQGSILAAKWVVQCLTNFLTKLIFPKNDCMDLLLYVDKNGERRGNWMTAIKEYDLDFKPSKIVRGQGLCKLAVESNDQAVEEDQGWDNELAVMSNEVLFTTTQESSWYADMKYFLHHGACPSHLGPRERRALRLKSAQYSLINDVLFRKNYDGVLLRCLEQDDAEKVLKDLHDGPAGGHFSGDTTANKVLRAGYYRPTLFKDAHAHARKCKIFRFGAGR